jgi:hypothetical protein
MIVHDATRSPVSGFYHLSHRLAKLSTPPSARNRRRPHMPRHDLDELANRLREWADKIESLTAANLRSDLIEAAKAVEELAALDADD